MSYRGGTYRGIQLASEFDKRGYLDKLFIPYYSQKHPYLTKLFGRFEDKQVVNPNKVMTNLWFPLLRRFMFYTRRFRNVRANDRFFLGGMLDKWVAARLDGNPDLLLVESHIALNTIKKAKELGIVTFLDRQAAQIEFQVKIWREEGMDHYIDHRDVKNGLEEYKEADYIIVPSSFVKNTFENTSISMDKIMLVSPGIDLRYFNINKIYKKDSTFRIIYCGGIYLVKGVRYLLEAFNDLKLKDTELWLIGNVGSDMQYILKKYEGQYKLLSFIANYELYKYYTQGSVLVLPSLQDSFGKVVIEAMACGLPVIVSENTGAKDVVRNGIDGFVVPIRDVETLKEKILYMYENPDVCRQMGQNAKERVNKDFTLDAYANRMINVFRSILNRKN
ncbi:MAG: glycosyltransferase family 4 protein [Thermodesulfobacteriota bacterium]